MDFSRELKIVNNLTLELEKLVHCTYVECLGPNLDLILNLLLSNELKIENR